MNTNENLQKGKVPPQAVDIEEVVIGALITDSKAIDVVENIKPEHFYKTAHQLIYKAILSLSSKKEPVDLLTISLELKKTGALQVVGGDFYLIELAQKIASSAHIEHHSKIIIQKSIQREMIKAANNIIANCYNETKDVFEMLNEAMTAISSASTGLFEGKESKVSEIVPEVLERGIKIFQGEIDPGIKTLIDNLTEKTGGFRNSELIILAARPGMGKTALAIGCGTKASSDGIPTAFFSLEMSKAGLVSRIISSETGIDGKKFNSKGLSPQDIESIQKARKKIDDLPLYIEDTTSLTIDVLRMKIKKMYIDLSVRFVIVDYLQLMNGVHGRSKNREQEIAEISRGLKEISMDLNIPIMALSQLSRGVETRGGSKRPLLSDLRESGAIEQDSDMVMFIYRPEYYGDKEWDDYGGVSCVGEAEYIVSKNRNGGLTRNRMSFDASCTKFSNLKEKIEQPDLFKHTGELEDDLPF